MRSSFRVSCRVRVAAVQRHAIPQIMQIGWTYFGEWDADDIGTIPSDELANIFRGPHDHPVVDPGMRKPTGRIATKEMNWLAIAIRKIDLRQLPIQRSFRVITL